MSIEITSEVAAKVLATIDAGLCSGVGNPVPGQMCVEAAVCFALGLPHGDEPSCVSRSLRSFKIKLNDADWSSNKARAQGLRRLALIQLGSVGHLDDHEFAHRVAELAIRKAVPAALRSAASLQKDPKHKEALLHHANACERDGTRSAVLEAKKAAAYTAVDATANAATATAAAYAYAYATADATAYAYAAAYAAAAAYATAEAAAYAADAAANAAYAAADAAAAYTAADATAYAYAYARKSARDKSLADFAEAVVQLLIGMKVPGAQWLDLAPLSEVA